MTTNLEFSPTARRRRRTHSAQFKAELVSACQQTGVSMAAIALEHGINANLLRRWVTEHERYGKHTLEDDTVPSGRAVDMTPANWIPIDPARALQQQVTASAPGPRQRSHRAGREIQVELAGRERSMKVRWPSDDPQGLARFARELLA